MPNEILSKYFIRRDSLIKNITTGNKPTQNYYSEVYQKIVVDLMELGIKIQHEKFIPFVNEHIPYSETNTEYDFEYATCEGPEQWCYAFFARHNYYIDFDPVNPGKKVNEGGLLDKDIKELESLASLELHKYNFESKRIKENGKTDNVRFTYTKEQIKDTLNGLPVVVDIQRKEALRETLKYDPEQKKPTNALLRQFLESLGAYSKFNRAILKHFLWQVKKNVYGGKVNDPLFINFFSIQGAGKTAFLRGLYSPLEVYSFEPPMMAVRSEGYAKLWSSKYIVYFDEIRVDSADKKDMYALMTNLKYLLTMDTNMYRVFTTQEMAEKKRTFSALSTSNISLMDTLYDPSGMRRFYEFKCEVKEGDETFKELPFIHDPDKDKVKEALEVFKNLWLGIDEELEEGYLTPEYRERLKSEQEKYHKPDCIEIYEIYNSSDDTRFVKIEDDELVTYITNSIKGNKHRSDFEAACREEGLNVILLKEYREELVEWNKTDGGPFSVYALSRLPSKMENHGIFIAYHNNKPYVFRSLNLESSLIGG